MKDLKSIDIDYLAKIFYVAIVPSMIIFACLYGILNRPQNLVLDMYSLKCKKMSWDSQSKKTSCHDFDLVYEGTQKFLDVTNSKNEKMFEFINEHCLNSDDKKTCKSIVTNFTTLEVKNIYSGSKKIDTDLVGNLSAM
ncbi:MAG: hypothetical protein K2X69_13180 [Silvanigrellaceae bacterium]|nr:hypothetical protein [Silvanigrellaceae bacterium]